ncbi:MAG: fatty acid desaturase [Limnobacter sp.]|nr:fatty acid desaturase [Limnobacter sp.]
MNPAEMTDAQRSQRIREEVLQASEDVRRQYPILKHQDAIGATIMIVSLLGMIGSGWLYIEGMIAWWVCVPVTAIFASFIHELEHDLIHSMYFRHKPWVNNLMLAVGWLARASTISPFVRRKLHMHHHKFSGTDSDLEERGITNGEKWGIRRFFMTGDNMMAIYLRPITMVKAVRAYIRAQKPGTPAEIRAMRREQLLGYSPLGTIYYALFHAWVLTHAVLLGSELIGMPVALPAQYQPALEALNVFAVVYMLPSFLRTFCLHFISSNMHYYGDVESRNPLQQTQVLNVWWLLPFQLFCFNFGSTHAIHHFVVKETFYVRQLTAKRAHKVMREMGVRFNDLGTFTRSNRYSMAA